MTPASLAAAPCLARAMRAATWARTDDERTHAVATWGALREEAARAAGMEAVLAFSAGRESKCFPRRPAS